MAQKGIIADKGVVAEKGIMADKGVLADKGIMADKGVLVAMATNDGARYCLQPRHRCRTLVCGLKIMH